MATFEVDTCFIVYNPHTYSTLQRQQVHRAVTMETPASPQGYLQNEAIACFWRLNKEKMGQ